jgi:hypothetical protein
MTHNHTRTTVAGPTVLVRSLRIGAGLSVLTVVWQGVSAGLLLLRSPAALGYHAVGAIVLHVFTAVTAIAAFLLWRGSRAPLWPTVLATVVFLATLCQAALGDGGVLSVHVPLAMLLMLGSGWLLAWSVLQLRDDHG